MTEKNIYKNPLIIAHRGASGYAPENSLPAFALAHEMGADGIELDVYLTRDGLPVVVHDEQVDHPRRGLISIRQLHSEEVAQIKIDGEKIPTLDEVLRQHQNNFKIINIEIKSTGLKTDGVEQKIVDLIHTYQLQNKVTVSSFNPLNLRRVSQIDPILPLGYLVEPTIPPLQNPCWASFTHAKTLNLDPDWIDDSLYKFNKLNQLNLPFWLWTVNSPKALARWLQSKLRIEALITNFPDRALALRSEIVG